MPKFSDAIYHPSEWFDPIYQDFKMKNGKRVPVPVPKEDRFNSIVNSAFAIKSEHSSLVQVADAAAYVYRCHLELKLDKEAWEGATVITMLVSKPRQRSRASRFRSARDMHRVLQIGEVQALDALTKIAAHGQQRSGTSTRAREQGCVDQDNRCLSARGGGGRFRTCAYSRIPCEWKRIPHRTFAFERVGNAYVHPHRYTIGRSYRGWPRGGWTRK